MSDNAALMKCSWRVNAQPWIKAVRGGLIESRRVATDGAIVNAVSVLRPARVLDVGCGEGWLCRTLAARGIAAVGVDACPELITAAQRAGGGRFYLRSYAELASLRPELGSFAAAVCNFSLLEEDLAPALRQLRQLLEPAGRLLIQTLHPGADAALREEWRIESFAGFEPGSTQPMPWYFRSLTSWAALLTDSGFNIESMSEPFDPKSGRPLSLLMRCKLGEADRGP